MKCPNKQCKNRTKFTILKTSADDNVDGLSHSHMQCDECGYNLNHWNEPPEKIKHLLGELYL